MRENPESAASLRGVPRPVRPRDAASLVVVRTSRDHSDVLSEVLMGRRPPRDRFMPDVYVFPGGRVEAADARAAAGSELPPGVATQLATRAPARARALAVAALRETFEETGLVFGELVDGRLRPDLACLSYVARAITPATNLIRYHARFLLADARRATGALVGNGELLDLTWVRLRDALDLPTVDVTQMVLTEVIHRLDGRGQPPPLIHYRGGRPVLRRERPRVPPRP